MSLNIEERDFDQDQDLRIGDGGKPLLLELVDGLLVLPQVELGAHKNDRDLGAVVPHLNRQ